MRPWAPEHCVQARDDLLAGWGSQAWQNTSKLLHQGPLTYEYPGLTNEQIYMANIRQEVTMLAQAELWWVGKDMCDLLWATMPSIPDDVKLEHLRLPSLSGLLVFQKPWTGGIDVQTGNPTVNVDAMCWGKAHLQPIKGFASTDVISASNYRYVDFGAGMTPYEMKLAMAWGLMTPESIQKHTHKQLSVNESGAMWSMSGGAWAPLGRSDWPIELELGQPVPRSRSVPGGTDEWFDQSTIEDRRLLAAMFTLIDSPGLADKHVHKAPRQQVRQAQRKGQPIPKDVNIVYLRRAHSHHGTGTGTTQYSHRWVVRAHPRLQACGPNHSERKLIMVGSHVKGPEGSPLVIKETVKAWVR